MVSYAGLDASVHDSGEFKGTESVNPRSTAMALIDSLPFR
ncbi:MAG: hypothetical protein J6Z05_08160 [Lachnospiraceae bacterium]|nr:hypothetical protein [Lachnospiraceae bacterium]